MAGGAALIMRGTVHRNTNDLDFFIGHDDIEEDSIVTMVAAVERALGKAGLGNRREVVSDTFARLTVETEERSVGSILRSTCASGRWTESLTLRCCHWRSSRRTRC